MKYNKDIENLLKKYHFTEEDREDFWKIIEPIYSHPEFQRRLDSSLFPHHGKKSLGDHIVSDAIVTYVIASKKKRHGKDVDVSLAVIIAMFHDLYELPWQNAKIVKNHIVNKHGFTHPLEAIVNAYTWFPEYFEDDERAMKIVDGVIHHMWPFPVRAIDTTFSAAELNNLNKLDNLDNRIRNIIIKSSTRKEIRHISFSRSISIEGRIVSYADTKVSIGKELKSAYAIIAIITGINLGIRK